MEEFKFTVTIEVIVENPYNQSDTPR